MQGVGFRPFVYRIAKKYGLKGYVLNTSGAVRILVQGEAGDVERFLEELVEKRPPLALIDRLEREELATDPCEDFVIERSRCEDGFVFISPDTAVCEECLAEMRDPGDRRYRYPFINCTNCGPRYTIIEGLPYDRPRTTMRVFEMCPECAAEYRDPLSRRFHAQPISCHKCGPRIWLEGEEPDDLFARIAELIREGKLVAIRGVGGFHIACDATNDEAVLRLREGKGREAKPLALMMRDVDMVRRYCYLAPEEEELLSSPARPIVLLRVQELGDISRHVAPGQGYLGVMLPYAPYHYLVFDYLDIPVVMTSANPSGLPIIKDIDAARTRLRGVVDRFVLHNRGIRHRVDDSVAFLGPQGPVLVRRARGYVPNPVKLPIKLRPSLALGAELKNTFSLGAGDIAIPSPHIGDLTSAETFQVYEETIEEYKRLFRVEPEVVVADRHPDYLNRQLLGPLREKGVQVREVQHHRAHIYSLMLDRNYTGPLIGFSFDGTGYGDDGRIWGGEVFLGDINELKRVYHLAYFPVAGGDAAILRPARVLLSYLLYRFPEEVGRLSNKFSREEIEFTAKMIERGMVFLTSSAGRMFDLTASLLGIRDRVAYEAQAAMELEAAALGAEIEGSLPFEIRGEEIDLGPAIRELLAEKGRRPTSILARLFHNTVRELIVEVAMRLRGETGVGTVGLSGGVFQNRLLLKSVVDALEEQGFAVLTHRQVPPNDGGISLGQLVAAREE